MSSLAPSLLLSMPQLVNPIFSRAVVLLCQHSDQGAFGLVVNRPLVTAGPIVVEVRAPEEVASKTTATSDRELKVWVGGPVEPQRSWILVGQNDELEGDSASVRITEGLYLSTSPLLLQQVLSADPPTRTRLIAGYSGWGPGQLEAELEASAWLISDVDGDLVFGTPPERMWEAALRRIGADPSALQMSRGVH
jgi:putative transcriptional regulator